jgi:hypothetical protein
VTIAGKLEQEIFNPGSSVELIIGGSKENTTPDKSTVELEDGTPERPFKIYIGKPKKDRKK